MAAGRDSTLSRRTCATHHPANPPTRAESGFRSGQSKRTRFSGVFQVGRVNCNLLERASRTRIVDHFNCKSEIFVQRMSWKNKDGPTFPRSILSYKPSALSTPCVSPSLKERPKLTCDARSPG